MLPRLDAQAAARGEWWSNSGVVRRCFWCTDAGDGEDDNRIDW